jgi:CheY-like chemotaxis protein
MAHRILVVDDDAELCELMVALLTKEGFDTEVATNGEDALAKARAHPPALILLDMVMPVMDGWTFRAHQRYDPVLAPIPVVLVTAVPTARLRNVGAVAALQKPFASQQLVSTVRANC